MWLSKLFHEIPVKNILVFLQFIKKCILCIYYKCKQGFSWFIKRLAISIGVAWSVATFFGTFAIVYVGFGLALFPTGTKGATMLLESIPVLMFKLFFGFLVAVFIFVCIPQGYNLLKALFSTKEQLKSIQDRVDNLSREIRSMKKRYERHITEQHYTDGKKKKETKKNSKA